MMMILLVLVLAGSPTVFGAQSPTAEEIMAQVAANQDRGPENALRFYLQPIRAGSNAQRQQEIGP